MEKMQEQLKHQLQLVTNCSNQSSIGSIGRSTSPYKQGDMISVIRHSFILEAEKVDTTKLDTTDDRLAVAVVTSDPPALLLSSLCMSVIMSVLSMGRMGRMLENRVGLDISICCPLVHVIHLILR